MKTYVLTALLLIGMALPSMAQFTIDGKRPAMDNLTQTMLLTVPENSFGLPYQATLVVDDTVSWVECGRKLIFDRKEISFPLVSVDSSYVIHFCHNDVVTAVSLHFTYLPIMHLRGSFKKFDYVGGEVSFTMPEDHMTTDMQARIRWAGSSTNKKSHHKHNFHVKFVDENGDKMDVSFFGLRNDNHWRLDAGLIDMGRIRNRTANGLWADMGARPYYADVQPNARSYTRGELVELFLNDEYQGFYNLAEYLDRKQMKLKKYDEETHEFHGMLWKGKDETPQTMFIETAELDNTQDYWNGYNLQYPDIDDVNPTDYSILSNAIDFVGTSSWADFAAHVGEYFDLPVLADYYVFINVLLAIDNSCKNLLWGCYDGAVDKRLTPGVWDLDATVGQHWSDIPACYRIPEIGPENELTQVSKLNQSRLFTRLMGLSDFRRQVLGRYWQLRPTVLDPDSLIARYATTFDYLDRCGALDRETVRWSGDYDISYRMLDFDEELEYLSDWLRRRIAYLDTHTFARLRGDVNCDGEISITDINNVIDVIFSGGADLFTIADADVNQDGEISLADINTLIDLITGD